MKKTNMKSIATNNHSNLSSVNIQIIMFFLISNENITEINHT